MFNARFALVSLRIKGDVRVQAFSLSLSFSLVLVLLTESSVLASLIIEIISLVRVLMFWLICLCELITCSKSIAFLDSFSSNSVILLVSDIAWTGCVALGVVFGDR